MRALFSIFFSMKKFIAPIVLLLSALVLAIYLTIDFSGVKQSFDSPAYLVARTKIDSLELLLWNTRTNPNAQVGLRLQLDSSWKHLNSMRNAPAVASNKKLATLAGFDITYDILKWIICGIAAVSICVVILIFVLKHHKEVITRRLEALKTERFKETKSGLDETTIPPQKRQFKRSIIDEAKSYAENKRNSNQLENDSNQSKKIDTPQNIAFEDENGVPENKILASSADKPNLRPTAKERITSAMQNLSDVLRAPRGVSRERTMKLRAQSRNMTGNPKLGAQSPLEATRFDKEFSEKNKILQMSRRGFPASAIASSLKISQEHVESVIKESQE